MTSTTLHLSEPFGTVAYRETGLSHAGKVAPVVLIHGVGMQSAAWGPQLGALEQSHHVIALDMPGHGGSDQIPAGSDLPVFLDWLLAVLDALALDRVNLAGHSMGALIAGGLAVRNPNRVERVALLNGVFCRDDAASKSVIDRAKLIGTGSFDVETPLQRWFGDTPIERAARDQVAAWLSAVSIDGYATAYGAFARGDALYADGFGLISAPLLALTGDGDPNSTPAMSHAMAEAAPRGTAVVIENHRHMVNLTAPDTVNAALEAWLETPLEEGGPK
ncbi:alpha/beta fold hydrolase [Rhodobacteraceae bacterium B1Z28]|uniref:Alpha/beta fold hydrolase n=1 Tax=Ruegeria haliotis TaxID=2747601 RepID=A0ABX2PNJ4_9RHOB|nr:alpha/beta hydrolase [Ruegeria haliotis]NVO55304.1 alpha/beta fold hydrolase [Ruegeria haliotis]